MNKFYDELKTRCQAEPTWTRKGDMRLGKTNAANEIVKEICGLPVQ